MPISLQDLFSERIRTLPVITSSFVLCTKPSALNLPAGPRCPRGLTRVELALCVVVISVLTAFLLPRISEWKAEGRSIQLTNAMASVNRAVVIFQAECSRRPQRQCDRLVIHDQTIAGAHGHAAATADGIARLAALPPEFALQEHTIDGVPALTMSLATPDTSPCEFTYLQAPTPGSQPAVQRPEGQCH